MTTMPDTDCRLCLDGMVPTGIHPVFGPVYRICPACYVPCGACSGTGLFPADNHAYERIVDAIDALGFDTDLCPNCLGVIGVTPRIWGAAA